ncbi:ABC transporter permease [Thermogemmatispora aurantia]|jgi:NitT/TauT family transport system permease protein|uniref:ABC transporter permease n=1 Tax=Thermogemmatispora aurantia TaxID=2045279 RepID=A0A5J4K6S4_9CHLR|nr:ABC transporter permease [Thermogemmatispora aurantia]
MSLVNQFRSEPSRPVLVGPSALVRQAQQRKQRQQWLIYGSRLLLVVGVLLFWQFASGTILDSSFLSNPLAILRQTITWLSDGDPWYESTLIINTAVTLEETLLGLFFGVASGLLLGFLFGLQPTLERIFNPFIIALNSIPKIALAPLFILWLGIEIPMKVVLAAVTVFFLIFLNTLNGVRNVDQHLVDAVRLMGGRQRDVIFKVILPSATGSVLTGLHVAIPYALIGAIVAEQIGANHGIGYLIQSSGESFNAAGIFAALLVLTLIAGLLNAIVNLIDRKTSHWKAGLKLSSADQS